MADNHRWPTACHLRLIDLIEQSPHLSNTQIGQIIAQMPEAKTAGVMGSKNAISGKIWRMRRWNAELATVLRRSGQPTRRFR